MKIVKFVFVVILLTFMTSSAAFSHPSRFRHSHHSPSSRPTVGAPLDGGILALLGAAGVAYYAARKKKKNNMDL